MAGDNGDLAGRLERTERALEEALEEKARLWDEANRRRAAEQELTELRKRVQQIEGSPAWRVTAPLRLAKKGFRRGVQKIGR